MAIQMDMAEAVLADMWNACDIPCSSSSCSVFDSVFSDSNEDKAAKLGENFGCLMVEIESGDLGKGCIGVNVRKSL